MTTQNYKRLRFRRQFLLCSEVIDSLTEWIYLKVGINRHLYVHPDLQIVNKQVEDIQIVLLGEIFDPRIPERRNHEILEELSEVSSSYGFLIDKLRAYAGQFVLIYATAESVRIIHDALGLREVYYCSSRNRVICGSQPNLLREYSDPPLGLSSDPLVVDFKYTQLPNSRNGRFWIGDETYLQDIRHLLPNHLLRVPEQQVARYWPRGKIDKLDLDEVVDKACEFLQGALNAAAQRHPLMMAVTGGTDSRTLLAASHEITGQIYYFINKHRHMADDHPDIIIPSSIFAKIGLPFHVHDIKGDVDPEFREVFLENTLLACDTVLPAIFNVYYAEHSEKLNILGVGEIGRAFYGHAPRKLDGFYLARTLKFKDSRYAVKECQKWLNEALPAAQSSGVNIMTLLLWEQLLGNWGAVGNSESDIAIEEFDPFNSHYLYELLLSVDQENLRNREDIIFQKMIGKMWPELLGFPFNPPKNWVEQAKQFAKSMGILGPLRSILYSRDRARYNLKNRDETKSSR